MENTASRPSQADISKAGDRNASSISSPGICRLDILVNNAGVAPNVRADLLEARRGKLRPPHRRQPEGPLFPPQRAAHLMIDSVPLEASTRAVVNVTSISAYTVSTNRGDLLRGKSPASPW